MIFFRIFSLIFLFFVTTVVVKAQEGTVRVIPEEWVSKHFTDHPLVGKMFNAKGKQVPQKVFPLLAQRSRFILLGENHDNPDHHLIQAAIVDAIGKSARQPSVVFEMIPRRLEKELHQIDLSSDPALDNLAKRLEWEKRGWYTWDIYRPIALAAVKNDFKIAAGNLSRDLMRAISKQGLKALDGGQVEDYGLAVAFPENSKNSLLVELETAHCGLMPKQALSPMINVQRATDGALADALKSNGNDDGAILIAGNGHVRKDRGVPHVLSQLLPGTRVVTINGGVSPQTGKPVAVEVRIPNAHNLVLGLLEVDPERKNWADYEIVNSDGIPLYDYVILTPKFDVTDHCDAMRKRFGKPTKENK